MPTLDIFNSNAFGVVSLTDAINLIKYKPGLLGQLGLFTESSVTTLSVAIEQKGGVLNLVKPSPRGSVGETEVRPKRNIRNLSIPHFQRVDEINADEVQGVRAFGQESETETVQGLVTERMAVHVDALEVTHEHSRLGAVKGVITYADGTSTDLFNEFGVSQVGEIDLDLDNASPKGGFRKTCAGISRTIAKELGGTPFSGVGALIGDNAFDDLIKNPDVRETYLNWSKAQELKTSYITGSGQDKSYGAFEFGGIVWYNYRGYIDASTPWVDTDKAHFFPLGVPNLFRTYWAPADYVEAVNTPGQRLYAKQEPKKFNKGVDLEIQSNALHICTRPRVLLKGKRT